MNSDTYDTLGIRQKRRGHLPIYQYWLRRIHDSKSPILKKFYKIIYGITRFPYSIEISTKAQIGPGLYISHPYNITVHSDAIIGSNCNFNKGMTIGKTNRGNRAGIPVIGNNVWIGINAVIVGKIHIGNDVLIAPNSYVNIDIPDHSVVIGNPCIIKYKANATEGYISNTI